uniref:Uncharacterized protein n=1 Tax=Ascaris lumbricoides TaxID=6252 RepID=A0A0M3HJ79_ASCLU
MCLLNETGGDHRVTERLCNEQDLRRALDYDKVGEGDCAGSRATGASRTSSQNSQISTQSIQFLRAVTNISSLFMRLSGGTTQRAVQGCDAKRSESLLLGGLIGSRHKFPDICESINLRRVIYLFSASPLLLGSPADYFVLAECYASPMQNLEFLPL